MRRGSKKVEFLYVSCYQLKIDCYIYVSSKPQGSHKTKMCNRHAQDTEKGIKIYPCEKSSVQKGRQQERKKETAT